MPSEASAPHAKKGKGRKIIFDSDPSEGENSSSPAPVPQWKSPRKKKPSAKVAYMNDAEEASQILFTPKHVRIRQADMDMPDVDSSPTRASRLHHNPAPLQTASTQSDGKFSQFLYFNLYI